jgi:Tol biopolymer transport system component
MNDPADSEPSAPSPAEEGYLIFDSDRDGLWQLYSITESGTDLVRLTDHPAEDRIPRWRPATGGS